MKKIAFSDKYGLTQAVKEGRKNMTRRIIKGDYENVAEIPLLPNGSYFVGYNGNIMGNSAVELRPLYQIGEVVAVAQTYKDCGWNPDVMQSTFVRKPTVFPDLDPISTHLGWVDLPFKYHKGWTNKMFVRADLMRLYIRVTNIKAERMQDISDADCLREGVERWLDGYIVCGLMERSGRNNRVLGTPREAFAALIDRISGRGTWERNPWTYAYEFELVKMQG